MTKARSNAVAEAAKGDLSVGSGTNLAGILAVGSNGETLVADSSTSTGLRWQGDYAAGKNKIINGDFNIWQRGTNFSGTNQFVYTADRWQLNDFTNVTSGISRQTFTPGTAPVAGYEGSYFARWTRAVSPTSTSYFYQRIEDVRTFAGQTVTVSFWAKADATKTLGIYIDQVFGSGGSSVVGTSTSNYSLTTSWARYTATFSLASISGKTIGTSSYIQPTFYVLSGDGAFTIDLWGVQVEAGSVATAFQTATGTIQGELAACQRYYAKSYNQGTNPATATATGSVGMAAVATGANANIIPCRFPVEMRTTPTVTIYSPGTGTSGKIQNVSAASDVNATDLGTGSAGFGIYVTGAPGGAVGYWLAGQFTASAEL